MYADRRETFVNKCADMLFTFPWQIVKHQFKAIDLGPGLISMSPIWLTIREATETYSSNFEIIRRLYSSEKVDSSF